jgi:DNA replication licensing factor MCM5
MTSYDYTSGLQGEVDEALIDIPSNLTRSDIEAEFVSFLLTHRGELNEAEFPYRDQLISNYLAANYYIEVDLQHLMNKSQLLSQLLVYYPGEYLSLFESAANLVSKQLINSQNYNNQQIQIQLYNYPKSTGIRELSSRHVGRLVAIRGIVISAGKPRIKATKLQIICRNCKLTKQVNCGSGFGGVNLPRTCDSNQSNQLSNKCPLDPYQILADNSEYIDQQRLKLQETPESIPVGELPRHLSLSCDRYLVGKVKPGTRVNLVGMYTTYEVNNRRDATSNAATDAVGIRIPYLRVFGISQDSESNDYLLGRFDPADEEILLNLSRSPDLYNNIAKAMCPAIFDNDDIKNVKKSLAVQLFGGSRKQLPDGMRLRGDVNILLLGDPSVAKSQFLKFTAGLAPIGVYTSGKGSSAAGLTASVIRDPSSGEFTLEGGALVLADGGLVCIDEFDKMRDGDRVAIHEAMEQQTISIAKAGITTILNSRTSVLAAANPIFGRYDDMRTAQENIDFQTSILSRFDMIYILRDIRDEARDREMAKHIINVHRLKDEAIRQLNEQQQGHLIPTKLLKKYIAYARQKIHPRLTESAAEVLKDHYVKFRSQLAAKQGGSAGSTSIPITVRQLEAIIRISEALARMRLSNLATEDDVREAVRLFQVSTYRAATSDSLVNTSHYDAKVKSAENEILQRIPIGSHISTAVLIDQCIARKLDEAAIRVAINNLSSTHPPQFEQINQGKILKRLR